LGPQAPVWVRSSGVRGLEGQPAVEQSRALATGRGLDLSGHRGSVSEPASLLRADLVLTMTESQRGRVVRRAPKAHARAFTVLEFARLCAALKPIEDDLTPRDRVRLFARLAHGARVYVERPADGEDIADPYGRPDEAYHRIGEQLDAAVATIAPQLFGWLPHESE
jgi:protein-tyrosine phosphatase